LQLNGDGQGLIDSGIPAVEQAFRTGIKIPVAGDFSKIGLKQ
jgi:hypothetical protein